MIGKASEWLSAMTVLAGTMLLVACSTMSGVTVADGPCLDDSKACIDNRTAMVDALVKDPSRAWIGQSVDRRMAASGIRLFAYQSVMDSLDCPKLQSGIRELQSARATIGTTPLAGQTAERHNTIRALTVDTENAMLAKARRKACQVG